LPGAHAGLVEYKTYIPNNFSISIFHCTYTTHS